MLILENFKMALESIKSNKMRSFLTMLGIIIGISSVIVIVSVGAGAQNFMMQQFEAVGTTTVTVDVDTKKALDSELITMEDVYALAEMGDFVRGATPVLQLFGETSFGDKKLDTIVVGGTQDMEKVNAVEMVSGRFYSESESLSGRNVIVIDEVMAERFFGSTNVLGMDIDLSYKNQRVKLKIVGICKGAYGEFYMEGMPGTAYIPTQVALTLSNEPSTFNFIYLTSDSKEHTEQLGNAAVRLLEARHGNRGRDVYQPGNMLAQMDMVNSTLSLVSTFVAAVAAISLLVGGIGVMNIMLVAVTERTREIGIRKSLGAKTGAILFQFLTESAILTFIGGLIGLTIGYLGSIGVSALAGVTPVFSVQTILMTLAFSVLVGLFFGIYPARKAARLNPIDALRHE